jgi:hypothetical protein
LAGGLWQVRLQNAWQTARPFRREAFSKTPMRFTRREPPYHAAMPPPSRRTSAPHPGRGGR